MDADAVVRRHRVARVLRSARGAGRAHPRRRLPRRAHATAPRACTTSRPRPRAGSRTRRASAIPRSPRSSAARTPRTAWGGPERRPGRASRHHRRRGHLPRVRSHGVVRGVRPAAQGRRDPERRRQHRHRGDRVAPRARPRRHVRDHAERRRASGHRGCRSGRVPGSCTCATTTSTGCPPSRRRS